MIEGICRGLFLSRTTVLKALSGKTASELCYRTYNAVSISLSLRRIRTFFPDKIALAKLRGIAFILPAHSFLPAILRFLFDIYWIGQCNFLILFSIKLSDQILAEPTRGYFYRNLLSCFWSELTKNLTILYQLNFLCGNGLFFPIIWHRFGVQF